MSAKIVRIDRNLCCFWSNLPDFDEFLMFFRFEGPMGRIHSETYVSLDMPEMGEWEVIHPRLRKKQNFYQKIAF